MKTSSMRYKTDVKIKNYFEKTNSADSLIIILKRITSLFLNVKKKEEKIENRFESKKSCYSNFENKINQKN